MTEKTVLRSELGAEAKGKQFIVMNNGDSDFPKGTVVTCVGVFGERFDSDTESNLFMFSDVLLKPLEKEIAIKAGDRVRLVSERPRYWNQSGKMDDFLGSIQIVKAVKGNSIYFEDLETHEWAFQTKDITEILPNTLTFTELSEMLPELEVGTEFKTDYGSVLYVGTQQNPPSENKFFYWKSDDKPVSVTGVTVRATYTELQKEPDKPEFTEIDWKEALQIIADGGTVYADGRKIAVNKHTDFEDIKCYTGNYVADNFGELLNCTDWYKKTE